MSVALLVMSCGRPDYLRQAIESFDANVTGPITHRVIHEDSGDIEMLCWLHKHYPDYELVTPGRLGVRVGFSRAVRSAWRHLQVMGDYTHVAHLEDDFVFQRPVDLADVIDVLTGRPELAQIAFRRQAWYESEQECGGWCEKHAEEMVEREHNGHWYLEHTRMFTTNPCVYARGVMKLEWPPGEESERRFLRDRIQAYGLPWGVLGEDVRCGMWGTMESGARWVEHIGHERAGGVDA